MLRLTVTVYQTMSDANIVASVHQEDPYGAPSLLGETRLTYDMASRLETYDELSALLDVLKTWVCDVQKST